MPKQPAQPPNQLSQRRPFDGDVRAFIQRLSEEIEELGKMKQAGFSHTADGVHIDSQIALRHEYLQKAAKSTRSHGRW